MYKATRSLIKARQQYSRYVVEKLVRVRQVGGGVPNDCFNNACAAQEREAGVKVVSGWVVDRYNASGDFTEITQHWWNVDKKGTYFDTTPGIGVEFEYVVDVAIAEFGQKYLDQIDSCVCSSLVLQTGKFMAINLVGKKLITRPIPDVSNDSLFETRFFKEAA
jgi:hypothetical protein